MATLQTKDNDVTALVSAWRQGTDGCMRRWTPRTLDHARRPSCGFWNVSIGVNDKADPRVYAQHLGEQLRLASMAASLGPEMLRAVIGITSDRACPHLECAWCDATDGHISVTLELYGDVEKSCEIVHASIFGWDETTASNAFKELRDVLAALHLSVSPSASLPQQPIDIRLKLYPTGHQETLSNCEHIPRLRRAMEMPSCGNSFRVVQLMLDTGSAGLNSDDHASLLNALLRFPVPQSIATDFRRWPNASTLMAVISEHGLTLSNVTRLDLTLDAAVMSDVSSMSTLCDLLTTKSPQLQSLSLEAIYFDDSNDQHRRSIERLSAALAAASRVESLRVSGWISVDRFMNAVSRGLESTWPTLRTLTVTTGWSANALVRFVSKCPNLRELTVKKVKRAGVSIDQSLGEDLSALPALTKLTIKRGWHPDLSSLITRAGASLTHLRIAMPLETNSADIADTIARHCPSIICLGACDPDCAFFEAIAEACDEARLRRLRRLTLHHYKRPVQYMDRTCTLASVRLLQLLSDPSRRLAHDVQTLDISVPPQDYTIVEQAMNLMLRCNPRIVDVGVDLCQHSRHHDSDLNESTVYSHSESDDFDLWDDAEDRDVGDLLNEMIAAAAGKTAVPHDGLLRDVVLPPSLRRRLALISVFADRGVQLPAAPLQAIFLMASRCARRRKIFFRVLP
ncbi:hypothetical protein PINS_up011548 [Pythium insidiosum]|nr:hypothetical protein PINS_up011548 [Pythium insidiosum]